MDNKLGLDYKRICEKEGIDFDEMQKFIDEIHEKLGKRPKIYPCIIESHCVIPNLDLIQDENLDIVKKLMSYLKNMKIIIVIKNLIL